MKILTMILRRTGWLRDVEGTFQRPKPVKCLLNALIENWPSLSGYATNQELQIAAVYFDGE
jgi:hypothetical protein